MAATAENSPSGGDRHPFATTRWSVVLLAADRAIPRSREALASLCEAYWYPLYAFIRRQGYRAEEASDLTQGFFTRLLEKNYLREVKPERGKFRSFLLGAVRHFLSNQKKEARAVKRGEGRAPFRLDFRSAESRYLLEPAHELTAERIYERRWALTLLDQVLARLRKEMTSEGKGELFERLKFSLTGEKSGEPYSRLASELSMSEGAVKVAVHRLRGRYREILREEIAETLGDPAGVDEEIRCLFSALATRDG